MGPKTVVTNGLTGKEVCYHLYQLGLIDYREAWQLQRKLVKSRLMGRTGDIILVLEHPAVFTIGRSGGEHNVICRQSILEKKIPVIYTDRGGDITCHSPGQLVVYPILNLKEKSMDLYHYVRSLEEIVISTLADFSIRAGRISGFPGVWIGHRKICSIGIRVIHWVTSHGFALNVSNDLSYFSYIHPCGIINSSVTSVSKVLGHEVSTDNILPFLLKHFSLVFNGKIHCQPMSCLSKYLSTACHE